MRVVGVIDVRGGLAVHARGGRRDAYAPVRQVGATTIPAGDPVSLAREYTRLGIDHLYLADLDAIAGLPPQEDVVRAVTTTVRRTWVDAGVSSADAATHLARLGDISVVVGLETLRSIDALRTIGETLGPDRLAFSLDLRAGAPMVESGAFAPATPAVAIAAAAAAAGAGTIIVLDLARVGGGAGIDAVLVRAIRHAVPRATLAVGGGVRGPADLDLLASLGCDAALVATALIDGHLAAHDVIAARGLMREM